MRSLFVVLLFPGGAALPAQSFGERLLVSTAAAYVPDEQPQADAIHHEWTWDKRILVSLAPRVFVGIQHRDIYTRSASIFAAEQREKFDMVSVIGQYRLTAADRLELFAELVWSRGDYCSCGPLHPYRLENVHHGGLGLGTDFKLSPRWAVTGNFTLQRILNHPEVGNRRFGYNFYAVGVQYALRRPE